MDLASSLPVIFASSITGLVALLSVYFTNRGNNYRLLSQINHETQKERNDFLRGKCEELFQIAAAWSKNVATQSIAVQGVMKGDYTYDDAIDLQIKHLKPIDVDRIELLISAYFPNLQSSLEQVFKFRDSTALIQNAHKNSYKQGKDGKTFLAPYTDEILKFSSSIELLKAHTVMAIREIK